MRARYYEPGSGRFISEDPLSEWRNWFTYCQNDPVNKVDVTGGLTEEEMILVARIGALSVVMDVIGIGLVALAGSVASKTLAWSALAFLAMWFGGGVSRQDGSLSVELTNGLIGLVATVGIVGAPLAEAFSLASESPATSAIELIGAYMMFISAFLSLTALEELGVP